MLRHAPWLAGGLLALTVVGARADDTADRYRLPGPREVQVMYAEWHDTTRDRAIPAKIYYPADAQSPQPVIIFSHGLGGTREGYDYLGRHWASHGYFSVHIQHHGSDDAVWRGQQDPLGSMQKAILDIRNSLDRPLDVRFTLDRLEEMNRSEGPLRSRLDLGRVGVAGHSFGAYTVLAIAGQKFGGPGGRRFTFTDQRVKAAIAMSAPGHSRFVPPDEAFGDIRIPCMHMTGTRDTSPVLPDTTPEDRLIPYRHSQGADKCLVVFDGGDHMIFAGARGRIGDGTRDEHFHELIRMATTAFWEAYLRDDAGAKSWLVSGGLGAALAPDASFDVQVSTPPVTGTTADPH